MPWLDFLVTEFRDILSDLWLAFLLRVVEADCGRIVVLDFATLIEA